MTQAIEVKVKLPERAAVKAAALSGKKPLAEVQIILDDGDTRTIVVPVRVGRMLKEDGDYLPCDVDAAFDHIHELEFRVCFTVLTEMLGRRDYGETEMRRRLLCYGYREAEINRAIQRATEFKFLNEERFLISFIDERKRRGWGKLRIERELMARGSDPRTLPGYPERFFSREDDIERANQLLDRKRIPSEKPFEKLMRFLVSKGFSYDVAREAVREHLDS